MIFSTSPRPQYPRRRSRNLGGRNCATRPSSRSPSPIHIRGRPHATTPARWITPIITASPSSVFSRLASLAPPSATPAPPTMPSTPSWRSPDRVRRHVRFSWQPVSGVSNTDPDVTPKDVYLHQELRDRLAKLPARFMLMMTIGEAGDAFNDPTIPWPDKRIRVSMGTLTLTNVAADQAASGERISFNPWRLLPGLEPSGDPILEARP